MKLLLSLLYASEGNYLVGIDTDKQVVNQIELVNISLKKVHSCSGMVYSGNYLFLSFLQHSKNDFVILNDIYENKCCTYECQTTKQINGSLISAYPGRIYSISNNTKSINIILFDPENTTFIGDSIHYTINDFNLANFNITSLCLWHSRWFIAIQSGTSGFIFELSNNRIVFADIDYPNNIFFNNDQKLCFFESNKGLFHCGNDIFYIGNVFLQGIIEDRVKGGYWIGCLTKNTNDSILIFMNYKGKISTPIKIPGHIVNIVKAEGVYAQCH